MSLPFCNTCWLKCRGLGSFEGKANVCDLYEEEQLWTIQKIPGDEGSTRGLHALRNRTPSLKRMLHFVVTREFCRHSPSLRGLPSSLLSMQPPLHLSRPTTTYRRALNQRGDPLPSLLRHVCPQIT